MIILEGFIKSALVNARVSVVTGSDTNTGLTDNWKTGDAYRSRQMAQLTLSGTKRI